MKTIGDRLKQVREEAGLKQKDIAEMLGIQLPDYNRIENNKVDLNIKQIETLIKELDIPIKWIITGVGNKSDFDDFGEHKRHIKKMIHDMKITPAVLYSILSHYYGIIDKYTPTPPFFA